MLTVALEKAIYKPGDMSWTATSRTNAENAGGIQTRPTWFPVFAYMERILGGGGGYGKQWMRRRSGRR